MHSWCRFSLRRMGRPRRDYPPADYRRRGMSHGDPIGHSSMMPAFWCLPSPFLSGTGAAAGIALINSVGKFGGFFGPNTVGGVKNATGSYSAGVLYAVHARARRVARRPELASRAGPGEIGRPMCGIVAFFSRDPSSRPTALSAPPAALSPRAGRTAAVDRRRTGASAWATRGSASSISRPAISRSPARTSALQIVVNGEFYDFERRSAELEQAGTACARDPTARSRCTSTRTSARTACTSCAASSRSCSGTSRNQTLFAARDRFGIKPLFYARATANAVLRVRGQGAVRRRRAGALGRRSRCTTRSNLRRPPGSARCSTACARCRPATISSRPTSTCSSHALLGLRLPRRPTSTRGRGRMPSTRPSSGRRWTRRCARLRADVPVGCYLSGGLDSCAVLGLAARHHPRADPRLHADLRPRRLRRRAPSPARWPSTPAPSSIRSRSGRTTSPTTSPTPIWHRETFCINAHGVAKYLLSRAVRDAGYKVVLTGEGSDEILGGYPHFRRDMLLYNHAGQDPGRWSRRCWSELEEANPVSRGLLLPDGEGAAARRVKRDARLRPVVVRGVLRARVKLRALIRRAFLRGLWLARDPYRAS